MLVEKHPLDKGSMQLENVWDQAQGRIKEKVGETSYETWFSAIEVQEKDPGTLKIQAPDDFFKNWIVEHYQDSLQAILNELAAKDVRLEFCVNSRILEEGTQSRLSHFEQGFKETDKTQPGLNSRFTFENFVIGPSNRFASAASLAVAESPAKAYNPLFIYGGVGLGKTHLIQSVTHKIQMLHPQKKVSYVTSEQFTNELIDAIRHRSTTQFRKKYRNSDVLLIDDIHFIAGKESTQEEFFHTFNYLHNSHKQIIITSDRPPREIAKLEERLSSRFAWGLIADIQPPTFETRAAILRKKVENEPAEVPDDVINFIAEEITSNIRELEGALIRVVAYSLLEDKPISLDLSKVILKDMVKESVRLIRIDRVQQSVAQYFQIPLAELKAKKRNKNIVLARQIAMYLSRELSNMSLPEIGNAFGGKDHTTVLHSCKKIEREMELDISVKSAVVELTTSLHH